VSLVSVFATRWRRLQGIPWGTTGVRTQLFAGRSGFIHNESHRQTPRFPLFTRPSATASSAISSACLLENNRVLKFPRLTLLTRKGSSTPQSKEPKSHDKNFDIVAKQGTFTQAISVPVTVTGSSIPSNSFRDLSISKCGTLSTVRRLAGRHSINRTRAYECLAEPAIRSNG